jgi:toxin ParE1/3/4
MAFRIAPRARADLDEIWTYTFLQRGSEDIADRVLDTIGTSFQTLAAWPRAGRRREELRRGYRSFGAGDYVIFYRIVRADVVIQRILHGRRNIRSLFGQD